jgi:ATP-dependent helicase/nuclease subunit A
MSTPQQQMFHFPPAAKSAAPSRRNVVIEAGAGTGKTTAIVAEVLKLLLGNEELAPERIVLVTFTEKAAGEIADRIQSAMTEVELQFDGDRVRWPIDSEKPLFEVRPEEKDAVRRACAKQLARIDGLKSQTIHSFCQTLLRQYPIEAGVDPQFKIIEGFERSLLYAQVYDAWIDDETRLHPAPEVLREWEALLQHAGYLFLARKMIFDLVDRRDLLLDETYEIGSIAEYEATLRSCIETMRLHGDGRIATYFRTQAAPAVGSDIDAWIEFFAPIAADIRTEHLQRGICSDAMKALRGGDKGNSVYDLLVSHRAAAALLSLTRRFVKRLDEEKRTRGVVDFDDLLIRTLALLGDPAILERVRQQFDFIFVDEFQDTDRIQAQIIDALARDRSGAYLAGKTIVVGDPKQSIYGFRRADPETYDRFTRKLSEGGAEPRALLDQYRSDPPLVDAINALFDPLMAEGDKDPNVFRPAYHALRAAKSDSIRSLDARITLLGFDYDEGGERHTREAEAIANWIESNRDGDYRRFAILFRRMTVIDAYLDVFDRRGVPYVLPPTRTFLDRPAAVDLLAVLRAIAYPIDRGAQISAARTPYFALADTEIVAGFLSGAPAPSPALWNRFVDSIAALRDAAHHLTVAQLIDHLLATTSIESVYSAHADGVRALRHVEHVRAIAFTYDQKIGGSVRQFVDEIARRRDIPDEIEPSLLDETSDAVRILTIHAAKGLEFETVIVPDLEFTAKGTKIFTVEEPRSLIMRDGIDTLSGVCRQSGDRPLRELAKLREDAESRRLFYVALTRAKSDIVLVCNLKKPTRNGFGRYLIDTLHTDPSMWPVEPGRVVAQVAIGVVPVPMAFERMPAAETLAGTRRKLVDADLESALAHAPLVDCVVPQPAPVADLLPRGDVAALRAGAANRGAGVLLHRILERWDGASEFSSLVTSLAKECGADAEAVEKAKRRMATVSHSNMFQRIARAETVGREMPIAFLDENGTVVEKRLDRIIREEGIDTVIDYKSGEATPARLERDREQVALYCRAYERLSGRACRGALWYIDEGNDVVLDLS